MKRVCKNWPCLLSVPQLGGGWAIFPTETFKNHVLLLGTTISYNHFDPPKIVQ